MASFKDINGRTWAVDLNIPTLKRVKSLCGGVDLLSIADPESQLLRRLYSDPELLVNVIYAVCQPQAQAASIGDEKFGESLVGDVIDGATTALLQALTDFFPNRQRPVLKTLLAKIEKMHGLASDVAMERLSDPQLDAEIERLLRNAGKPSTNASGSSGDAPSG